MNEHGDIEGTAAWSRYWASGSLHSCPNAFAGNYDDAIRDYWLGFFGGLPDGARVLDIGTGNGAVAFLARDAADAADCKFHIEGIDAAAIDPAAAAAQLGIAVGDIVFRGGTACEHTPYPDDHFNAVSSQYAIEYSRIDDTLRELARILKPDGRAGFVLHHESSEALAAARLELRAFEYLRHEAPLLLESKRLLRRLGDVRNDSELAAALRNRDSHKQRKEVEKQLRRVAAYARSPQRGAAFLSGIAGQVANTLQQAGAIGTGRALRRLMTLETEMQAHQGRLRAIARAAQGRDDIAAFCHTAAAAGFETDTPRELRRRGRGDLLGWSLSATLLAGGRPAT